MNNQFNPQSILDWALIGIGLIGLFFYFIGDSKSKPYLEFVGIVLMFVVVMIIIITKLHWF